MNDVVIAWKKGVWGKNRIYPEIESKVFLGIIRLFDTDKNEQIFIHREGNTIYYIYLWRLSRFDYISLGLLTNKLCLDYYDLSRTFRTFVKDMAVNKLCVYNTNRGKIKLSSHNIQEQSRQRTLLDINIKGLKKLIDEKQKKWSNLPSQKLGISKSDIVPCTLDIQGSSWIVTQITSGYRNVCVSIRDGIKSLDENGRSKKTSQSKDGIVSIIESLQFLPKSSNVIKTTKSLKTLNSAVGAKEKNERNKHTDWDDVFGWGVIGVFFVSVLISLLAPWFISSMSLWLKLSVVAAALLGTCSVIYVLDDDHKGKYVSALGWSGAIAILLSTILTIYGICSGFSPDIVDADEELMMKKNKKGKIDVANNTLPIVETLSQRNDSVNNEADSSKIAPVVAEPIREKDVTVTEPVAKPLTQKERFDNTKRVKDWEGMRRLADEGYSPAYLPLARHYMNNSRQHGLAKKYAEKAKRAGIAGATEILNELEDLDY